MEFTAESSPVLRVLHRFLFNFVDIFAGGGRQVMPDFDGNEGSDDCERDHKNRQPMPALAFIGQQKAEAEDWLPVFVIPFAIIGTFIAIRIWHDLPAATRKYINEVEQKAV